MRILLSIVLCLLCCSDGLSQINLTIDQSQSSVSFSVLGVSDSSSVTGSGTIEFDSATPPFSAAQFTSLDLTLADGFDITILIFVSVEADPNSIMISLAQPGSPGLINGDNQFDQTGNLVSMAGTVDINDPLNLAGGSMTFDLAQAGLIPFDFNQVQVQVDGSDLTITSNLSLELDANGIAVTVSGAIVATGSVPTFLLGDVNRDGAVNLLDVDPFVALLAANEFQLEADMNQDGSVNLLDVDGFIEALANGG
ncbi:MAG: dockerin type I domain-containing protein [Planctomycetota bacterium]